MKHKFLFILLFSLVLEGMVTTQAVAGDYVHQVNTLIGTKGTGLTSGYLYPGATYPYGSNLSLWDGTIYSILFFQKVGIRYQSVEWWWL